MHNIEAGELFSQGHGFKVCMGSRYIDDYNRDGK